LEYVSQDFAQYDGEGDGAGLHSKAYNPTSRKTPDIACDITQIPNPDSSFDAILCTEVLEHLPHPQRAIQELARLCRTGGKLVLTAPFCSLTHMAPYFFYNGFSKYFYEKMLNDAGFEIEKMEANGNFFEYLAQEIRRVPYMTQNYTGEKLPFHQHMMLRTALMILRTLSAKDNGSAEMLNFGYHVLAKRI
jgi:2-polyprenyl-3-methyl-5-hydroxy-6-metoxy-1,4-benzoquinol methylase